MQKKSSYLRNPAFIFCLPWGRPCGNHAKRCMNEKTIQCLPNPSQRVPIYLQQFPSYSNCNLELDGKTIQCLPNPSQHVPIYLEYFPSYTMLKSTRKSKNRYFYHIFVSPGDAPGAITLNVVCMKENSMLTNCVAACVHLTITVSEIEREIGRKSSFFIPPCIRRPR